MVNLELHCSIPVPETGERRKPLCSWNEAADVTKMGVLHLIEAEYICVSLLQNALQML